MVTSLSLQGSRISGVITFFKSNPTPMPAVTGGGRAGQGTNFLWKMPKNINPLGLGIVALIVMGGTYVMKNYISNSARGAGVDDFSDARSEGIYKFNKHNLVPEECAARFTEFMKKLEWKFNEPNSMNQYFMEKYSNLAKENTTISLEKTNILNKAVCNLMAAFYASERADHQNDADIHNCIDSILDNGFQISDFDKKQIKDCLMDEIIELNTSK